jgi:hypothetical protein
MDRVTGTLSGDAEIQKAMEAHGEYIRSETLCDRLEWQPDLILGQELDLNGKTVRMLVSKVTQ